MMGIGVDYIEMCSRDCRCHNRNLDPGLLRYRSLEDFFHEVEVGRLAREDALKDQKKIGDLETDLDVLRREVQQLKSELNDKTLRKEKGEAGKEKKGT